MACAKRARAVAITDHDTVAALGEGRAAADARGIEFVPGIEISAEYSPGTMHVLGYYIDEQSSLLIERLDQLKLAREKRNPEIASRLQAMGMDIGYDEVAAVAGNEIVGRPHFAKLMVERGYARTIQDAFDRFLKKGAPGYVEKGRLSPRDSIEVIHNAGGVAVLAHPYQLGLGTFEEVSSVVGGLAAAGLDGIEALYSRHNSAQQAAYTQIAADHRLVVTGGSDFHGSYKPDIDIVTGLGNLKVPYTVLEELRARVASRSHTGKCD